jgi:DNA-binding transcriptional regulator GbsR (MarR family)
MQEQATRFIEEAGDFFETRGIWPSAGRIVGLLLISEKPRSAGEIARMLAMSRGSVSMSMKTLETVGILKRRGILGDRKVYHCVSEEIWMNTERQLLQQVRGFYELAKKGKKLLDPGNEFAHERLERMERFHKRLLENLEGLFERINGDPEGNGSGTMEEYG